VAEVSWDEAIEFAASKFAASRAYGREAIGGITSSRCTNEEVYVVQKMIRAAFGNNNVDTCARVCHSPTGYGLKQTFGTSAGTQDFKSVMNADVVVVIGANPTDAHPVFASRMKRRLRQGAKLIVIDPRRIDLVRSPHIKAASSAAAPGTNVAIINALAHVIVTEGLVNDYVASAAMRGVRAVEGVHRAAEEVPRSRDQSSPACRAARGPRRGAAVCQRRQCGDLLRPRRHRAQPGLAPWSWAWPTSPWRPATSVAKEPA
jgi:predicted molibdopterin-dependent oxidoreductase YjgC